MFTSYKIDSNSFIRLRLHDVMLCGGCKCLPVHHHSADYIFWSFGIIEFILSHLKIEFCLSRCQGGGGVAGDVHFITGREQIQ